MLNGSSVVLYSSTPSLKVTGKLLVVWSTIFATGTGAGGGGGAGQPNKCQQLPKLIFSFLNPLLNGLICTVEKIIRWLGADDRGSQGCKAAKMGVGENVSYSSSMR